MNNLLFGFLKKSIIVPVVVAALIMVVTGIAVPKMITSSLTTSVVAQEIDISAYNLKEYSKFETLEQGDYVASITADTINLNCAICYNSVKEINSAGLLKQSKEPWNKGSVAIIGENENTKFKPFHNATVGTKLSINFYKNAVCNYEITEITYNNSRKAINEQLKKNDLLLCVPYTNFDSPNGEKLYIIYSAKLGGIEKWS